MEKLSRKCQAICLSAVACLATAIVLAPASPSIPQVPSCQEVERELAGPAATRGGNGSRAETRGPGYQPMQNCTGGYSVNCHSTGNQAGL
ncbi:MAG TPA: hypothetical protein DCZ75_15580 [Geobacter sp.]|nr:hypothetical protein [Geobacter sp.]